MTFAQPAKSMHMLQAQFQLADADGDGALTEAEHFDFQHPEESSNAALHNHLLEEDVRDRAGDHHKDRSAARHLAWKAGKT